MKKILLVILFCTAASLNCNNGTEHNGHSGGKGMEPSQKEAALLIITNKLFYNDPEITIIIPEIAPVTGFGFGLDLD